MKIIFMGTPDFACESLKSLYEANKNIIAVVTNPDKPKGRGMKVIETPVKEFAKSKNIKIYQPLKVKNNIDFINEIKKLEPDILCVVAYGKILPKEILDIPKYGAINVHGSLLPKYRGAAPIQWAVIKGEKETGNTTMFMDEGMDTGDIIYQSKVQIRDDETMGELWNDMAIDGGKLLVKTINEIEKIIETSEIKIIDNEYKNRINNFQINNKELKKSTSKEGSSISKNDTEENKNTIEKNINTLTEKEKIDFIKNIKIERNIKLQNEIKKQIGAKKQSDDFSYAPMLDKKIAYINWNQNAEKINNLVRGLDPIIGAYSLYNGKKIKIWKTEIIDNFKFLQMTGKKLQEYAKEQTGTVIYVNKNKLMVKTKDLALSIIEVQAENSKRMNIRDFLNGNKIKLLEKFE